MVCYISHPYSASSDEERLQNVQKAIDVSLQLWKNGIHSLVPNLSHYIDLRAQERGISVSWEEYLQWDLELLEGCDCILVLGDSPGCKREKEYAEEIGMRIFTSIEEVVDYSSRHTGISELTTESQILGFYEEGQS